MVRGIRRMLAPTTLFLTRSLPLIPQRHLKKSIPTSLTLDLPYSHQVSVSLHKEQHFKNEIKKKINLRKEKIGSNIK